MLEVNGISYAYKKQSILKNTSFSLKNGSIIGLVAPNGTGKTTLLKLISKSLKLQNGTIILNNIDSSKRVKYLKNIFFLESIDNLYENLSVREHLVYVKQMWKSTVSIDKVLKMLNMNHYENRKVKKLSLGMKQHLVIAMYIVSDAELLLMDEPHNGLDPSSIKTIKNVFQILRDRGKTIFYSSHDLFNMENFCDRVLFLKNLKIELSVLGSEDIAAIYDKLYPHAKEELSW